MTEPATAPPPSAADGTPGAEPEPRGVRDLILEVLEEGPATGFDIARRLIVLEPGLLGAREGHLYPLLLEMRRDGALDAAWVSRDDGRRRVYSLPGALLTSLPDPAAGADAPPRPDVPEILRRFADACTAKLGFAPLLAAEARAEITAHGVDLAAARRRAGVEPPLAEKEALRALGDSWKIGTDLARAARGRSTVIFPRTSGEALLSLGIYDAWIIVAIVATVFFVRLQVVAAYHIPTKSMEPTLHGDRETGDRILVFQLAPPPRRFDLQVFDGWGSTRTRFVKRCAGLPGETVRIRDGDLFIDGRRIRKDGEDLDAMLFPVFDAAVEASVAEEKDESLAKRFEERWSAPHWSETDLGTFESPEGATDTAPAVLSFKSRLDDGAYDLETGDREAGMASVGDGRIALDVMPLDAGCRLLVRWQRDEERFDAVLRGEQPGVSLLDGGSEVARAADVSLVPGKRVRVRFSEVDRVLRLEIDGKLVLRYDIPEPGTDDQPTRGAEPSVRVLAGRARIRPVRLERDVHWTSEYESLARPALGPDEYFFLGDNSSNSDDCRRKGAVHRSRLVGKPILVVWPLSHFHVPR